MFAANPLITEKMKHEHKLLLEEKVTHSYPHCWRCKKPIIFRATEQWFLGVDIQNLRQRMLDEIKNVTWVPAYGRNRIEGMVEVRPDWCLSRQRYWGVPIPVLYCLECNEPLLDDKVIERVAAMVSSQGSDSWYEKSIEDILGHLKVSCPKCGGSKFKKEEDILDVWFDSGVSHEAVLASGNFEGLSWPADIYLEGSDQHRGWFQTSLIPATALRGRAPYKSVLTHGFVVDGEGKKMSKSLGNVIAPQKVIDQYGAEILRLWVATSDYREDIRISQEILNGLIDTYRKIRNTLRFLLGNLSEYSPAKDNVPYGEMREIDRHALGILQELVETCTNAFDKYEFHKAAAAINKFCTVELSGFYLDALKDTLYCDGKTWKSRRSAQTALWQICSALVRVLSPILSFTSEEVWQEMRNIDPGLEESVFLTELPKTDKKLVFNEEMRDKWSNLMDLRDKSMLELEGLRKEKVIGSNLEACLEVLHDKTDVGIVADKEMLSSVLGTWDIKFIPQSDPGNLPPETQVFQKGKSGYTKCERCWRYIEDVKMSDKYGGNLCPRCCKTLDER